MIEIEQDVYVPMPPIRTYEVTLYITSIKKGKPSICLEVEEDI